MKEKVKTYLDEISNFNSTIAEEIDQFRIRFLSKKGIVGELFASMKDVPAEARKEMGQLFNEVKTQATEKVNALKAALEVKEDDVDHPDLTLPVNFIQAGARHPLSIVKNEITDIFSRLGFTVSKGPEIENDWHNFSALNFPPEHPARDMQDTFFIEKGAEEIALRTHTSSVQIRVMENEQPPIRTILPGRVYRNEAISARAHCIFHQVEGLYVDEGVSFADLKQTLYYFATEMFDKNTKVRFRPSYFPFTEPSAEMDISCNICGGSGCKVCKGTGWVEILGCGMVDPNVFDNCGIDHEKYTGFAFGMGIERITMLKYQVNDLRLFFENDLRFLKQFEAAY